ncbi:ABC transporter permease [Levilactobacillus bambusae]|uniref:ABC transporter permease n=1 Tax=Levilactobacillus bambusae TaxID=2024736 RepID=A0A2V1N5F4_9LACO|nr:ABC transporter permease [Levilactobacillus bambusae]PWG00890.1 ABC transporter permease [Levilactobacillus bambusae]
MHDRQTWRLTRFNLRHDWQLIILWLLMIVGLTGAAAGKFNGLYGDSASITSIVKVLKMPAMTAILGRFSGHSPFTTADIFANEMMVFLGLFVAMMMIFFAVRNSRQEESNGELELIRSRSVSRVSPLLAAALELLIIAITLGGLLFVSLQASGMHGMTRQGNLLMSFSLAGFGWAFGTLVLVLAQFSESPKTVTGLSYLVLGISYLVRMLTDIKAPKLSLYTPLGWLEKLSPYHHNYFGPVWVTLGIGLICLILAVLLVGQRDLGAGFINPHLGRATASPFLRGPFSLLWRLTKFSSAAWLIGLFILGMAYGSIFNSIGNLFKSNPELAKIMGHAAVSAANQTLILQFIALLMIVFATLATIPALQVLLRLNTDEAKGQLELLHATATPRRRFYLSAVFMSLLIGTFVLVGALLGLDTANLMVLAHPIHQHDFIWAVIAYLPPIYTTLGLSALLVGLLPRWQWISWLIPAYGFISLYLGRLLDLPTWAKRLTPYGWINEVPVKEPQIATLLVLLLIAGAAFLIGGLAYCHRDLIEN